MTEETRIALLEQSIGHINETLIRIEKRFDSLENDIKQGFGRLENKIDRLENKVDSNFKWLLGIYFGGFAGLFGMMAHAMHWF